MGALWPACPVCPAPPREEEASAGEMELKPCRRPLTSLFPGLRGWSAFTLIKPLHGCHRQQVRMQRMPRSQRKLLTEKTPAGQPRYSSPPWGGCTQNASSRTVGKPGLRPPGCFSGPVSPFQAKERAADLARCGPGHRLPLAAPLQHGGLCAAAAHGFPSERCRAGAPPGSAWSGLRGLLGR